MDSQRNTERQGDIHTMATTTSHQSIFRCPICLDDFADPVSIPCGHNFCKLCINTHWDSADIILCPLCQQEFKKKPQLSVNVLLRELIEHKQRDIQKVPETETKTQDIFCDVCTGEKVMAVKSCLHCEDSFCSEHLKPHQEDAELKTHELLDPVGKLKERVCKKHRAPLELVCYQDLTCVCLSCIKSTHQGHKCVPLKKRLNKKKAQIDKELAEVQQEINYRKKLVDTFDKSRTFNEENTREDITDTLKIFTHMVQVVKMNEATLVTALTLLQRKAENRNESVKEKLEEELSELKERKSELEQLSQIGDDLCLLQSMNSLCEPPDTNDWSDVSAYSDSAVGSMRCAVSKTLMELHVAMTAKLKELVTKVDVVLDSDTANSLLIVSNDGKQVRHGKTPQKLPDNPERFDTLLGVLGKEGYSSGAFYFEVQVEGKASWDIGVALETVDRKKQFDVCLSQGFAVLMLRDGKTLKACNQPQVELNLPMKLKKVGVFVDHEEGEVCFYDVENKAHIFTFSGQFPKRKLHPYFNPRTQHEGNNSAPMVITPIS
ncbi:E3 ubiquitin-protein ligase TRIM21-like [Scomber japonicus]|uniref:E3 ubiquitin-protein ligase TRIM21-like n=1 Tax=Scomber japonicus TaxID=13676 RepID=UPI00230688DC|nr:E3 ubiquitin-protein ligase TRIM21-like [Scomber japonicus]